MILDFNNFSTLTDTKRENYEIELSFKIITAKVNKITNLIAIVPSYLKRVYTKYINSKIRSKIRKLTKELSTKQLSWSVLMKNMVWSVCL